MTTYIFFNSALLFTALAAMSEIPALYAQRPIVLRHQHAALYHPFIEALALTLVDIPITFITIVIFSIILYFMTGLQRTVVSNRFTIYLASHHLSCFTPLTHTYRVNSCMWTYISPIFLAKLSQYLPSVRVHNDCCNERVVQGDRCTILCRCDSTIICRYLCFGHRHLHR